MEGTSSNICHRFVINEQFECIKLAHTNMTAARDPKLFLLTRAGEIVEEESWRGNHGTKWCRVVQIGTKWYKVVQSCTKWYTAVQLVPREIRVAQERPPHQPHIQL